MTPLEIRRMTPEARETWREERYAELRENTLRGVNKDRADAGKPPVTWEELTEMGAAYWAHMRKKAQMALRNLSGDTPNRDDN